MRRWVVVLALVAVALGAGATLWGRGRAVPEATPVTPPAVPVEVAAVTRGTVTRTVEVSGTVVSARSADVVPKIGGRVVRVFVTDGARVAAGQPLIALDAADQRNEVRQAEAAVAAAEARLRLLEAGGRAQERRVAFNAYTQAQNQAKVAATQVTAAEAALRVAEDSLRRQEQLLREGAVAQAQVDQARLQYDQARAQLAAAQTQLEIAHTAVDSARQQWDMIQTGARKEELQAARAGVAQARAALAMARQRLDYMTIRAPFAGRVAGVTVSVGDYVTSGDLPGRSPVAVVYDDRALDVEVTVGERDIGLVRLGQTARLRLETAPDVVIQASVAVISPATDPISRASAVRLRLKTPAAGALPGMFARGEIVVDERSGVLLVPRTAVVGGERPIVRVVSGGAVQVRPVTVGLAQGDRVEIKTGVADGETVVVLGPEDLPSGTAVKAVGR